MFLASSFFADSRSLVGVSFLFTVASGGAMIVVLIGVFLCTCGRCMRCMRDGAVRYKNALNLLTLLPLLGHLALEAR